MAAGMGDFGVGTRAGGADMMPVDDGQFDYHEKVLVETSQRDGQDLWVRPEGGVVNQAGPFNFTIPPLSDRYIQLNRVRLYSRVRVTREDGSRLSQILDVVAPVNLLGATMWERVEVMLNGKSFAGSTQVNAGYKAYLETMLSYDTDGANSHLHSQFYHRDSPGMYGVMRLSPRQIREGVRRALVSGEVAGPYIPDYLQPDINSEDYKRLEAMQYKDSDVLDLPEGVKDPNNDGLLTSQSVREAREEEARLAQYEARRRDYINRNVNITDEEVPEPPQEDESAEEAAEREGRNREIEARNLEIRADNRRRRQEADAAFSRDNPLTERQKRRRRRERYRDFATNVMAELDSFLYTQEGQPLNQGFSDRYNIVAGSEPFDMMSPITHDFFKMNNHLAPNNRVDLRLTMYPHPFLLNSQVHGRRYKLVIEDLKLHYHTIALRDRVNPPLKETYLLNATECTRQIVSKNVPTITFRLHNGGIMPKTIIVGQVWAEAADGTYDYNPWNLHHFHVKKMQLIINGESYPQGGLEFDFSKVNPLASRGYHWMFENTGAMEGEKGNIVHWQAFLSGAFIVPFDLTPDKCNGLHAHTGQNGFIDLQIEWEHSTPDPIYIVYETVTPKVLINDRVTGQVFTLDIEA